MKNQTLLTFLLSILLFSSCSNENNFTNNDLYENKSSLHFTYKSIPYSAAYSLNSDSLIIFDDENISKLIKEIQYHSELATLVEGDTLHFFETELEMNKFQKEQKQKIVKSVQYQAYAKVVVTSYSRHSGKGKSFGIEVSPTKT